MNADLPAGRFHADGGRQKRVDAAGAAIQCIYRLANFADAGDTPKAQEEIKRCREQLDQIAKAIDEEASERRATLREGERSS